MENKGAKNAKNETRPEWPGHRSRKFAVTFRKEKEIPKLGHVCRAQVTALLQSTPSLSRRNLHSLAGLPSQQTTYKNLQTHAFVNQNNGHSILPPIYNDFMKSCSSEDKENADQKR